MLKTYVLCLNNSYAHGLLTVNKVYEALEETDSHYIIIDDNGEKNRYNKGRFEFVRKGE